MCVQTGRGHFYIQLTRSCFSQEAEVILFIQRRGKNNLQSSVFVQKPTLSAFEFCFADNQVFGNALQNREDSGNQSL